MSPCLEPCFNLCVKQQQVSCLDVGPLPAGRARSMFLAVGCLDNSVRLLSLEGGASTLMQMGQMECPARPESLALAEMASDATAAISGGAGAAGGGGGGGGGAPLGLFLNVGLSNGVMQRVSVDQTSGALSDTRHRFLGSRPVRLFRVVVQGVPAVLALSSRGWLAYALQGRCVDTHRQRQHFLSSSTQLRHDI
jgi:splicing factor 3B subunit 3